MLDLMSRRCSYMNSLHLPSATFQKLGHAKRIPWELRYLKNAISPLLHDVIAMFSGGIYISLISARFLRFGPLTLECHNSPHTPFQQGINMWIHYPLIWSIVTGVQGLQCYPIVTIMSKKTQCQTDHLLSELSLLYAACKVQVRRGFIRGWIMVPHFSLFFQMRLFVIGSFIRILCNSWAAWHFRQQKL